MSTRISAGGARWLHVSLLFTIMILIDCKITNFPYICLLSTSSCQYGNIDNSLVIALAPTIDESQWKGEWAFMLWSNDAALPQIVTFVVMEKEREYKQRIRKTKVSTIMHAL